MAVTALNIELDRCLEQSPDFSLLRGRALASCDVLLKPRFAPSSGSAPSKPWVSALLACSLAHSAPRPRAIRSREVSALSLFHLTLAVFQMPRYCGNSACCQLLQPCSNGNENQGSMPRILGACSRWIPLPHLAGARPGAGQQERICRAAASLLEWHTQATRRHLLAKMALTASLAPAGKRQAMQIRLHDK